MIRSRTSAAVQFTGSLSAFSTLFLTPQKDGLGLHYLSKLRMRAVTCPNRMRIGRTASKSHSYRIALACASDRFCVPRSIITVINPRRACAARVCSWVCLSVCLFVCYSISHFSNVCSSQKRYRLPNGQ